MRELHHRRLAAVAAVTTALVICAAPSSSRAQCAFDRTSENGNATAYYYTSLVPAYVNCGDVGGNTPNTQSQGGVPACTPTQTLAQQAGSPATSWRFSQHPGRSYGRLKLYRYKNSVTLAPIPFIDIGIRLYLREIIDGNSASPNATGSLRIRLRATTDDPVSGDQMVIDFPLQVPVPLTGGSASINTSVGQALAGIGQPPWSPCTSLEVLSVEILDPNGLVFAVPGVRVNP